jgi:hypothetical protein
LFGWLCEYRQDQIAAKRRRMVAEFLNGGFEGLNYVVLETNVEKRDEMGFERLTKVLLRDRGSNLLFKIFSCCCSQMQG